MKMFPCKFAQVEVTKSKAAGRFKKSVQQGRSHFYGRSVCSIREHGKMARTPLAAFFNRPYFKAFAGNQTGGEGSFELTFVQL